MELGSILTYLTVLLAVFGSVTLTVAGFSEKNRKTKVLIGGMLMIGGLGTSYWEKSISEEKLYNSIGDLFDVIKLDYESRDSLYEEVNNAWRLYSERRDVESTRPEILGVKPFLHVKTRHDTKVPEGWPNVTQLGIFILVAIKSGSNTSAISAMNIRGRLRLSPNQYILVDGVLEQGSIDRGLVEWKEKRPFIEVEWNCYKTNKTTSYNLLPHQKSVVGFVVLEPRASGSAEVSWANPETQYIGYLDGSKMPTRKRKYPDVDLFFTRYNRNELPPKSMNEDLELYLEVNGTEIKIPARVVQPVDMVHNLEWDEDSFEKMYYRYYAEE
jgi:hypothetical protein